MHEPVVQHPQFSDAERIAHQQAQVLGGCVDLVAFVDPLQAEKPRASAPARLADAREAPFQQFTPNPLQSLALLTLHPVAVVAPIDLRFRRLVCAAEAADDMIAECDELGLRTYISLSLSVT